MWDDRFEVGQALYGSDLETVPGKQIVGISGVDSVSKSSVDDGLDIHSLKRGTQQIAFGDHVVTFDLDHGGMISSWTIAGTEVVNAPDPTKGIQAQLVFTDIGRSKTFIRHNLHQGGDRWATDPLNARGGLVSGFSWSTGGDGARVTVEFTPIVFDSDGHRSPPGVRSYHGGAENKPVYGVHFPMRLEWSFDASTNYHTCELILEASSPVESFWFDMSLYLVAFLDAAQFPSLGAYRMPSQTDTTISSGSAGVPGYQVNHRRYLMGSELMVGDDEAATSSVVPYWGIVGGRAASAASRSFAMGSRGVQDTKATSKTLGGPPNAWSWAQNRTGSGGPLGDNYLALAHGQFYSSRTHAEEAARRIAVKTARIMVPVLTSSWTGNKTLTEGME